MNHRYLLILGVVLVFVVFMGVYSLLSQPLSVTVRAIHPVSINSTDLTLDVTLNIHNPHFFGGTLRRITVNASYQEGDEWKPLGQVVKEGLVIQPGDNTVVLPVSARNMDLIRAGFQFLLGGKITILLEGSAEPSLPGFNPSIPFSETRTIPLPGTI